MYLNRIIDKIDVDIIKILMEEYMNINETLRSRPAAFTAGALAFLGVAALTAGLIATFGRFQAAHALAAKLKDTGRIATLATGGALVLPAVAVLFAHMVGKTKTTEEVTVTPEAPKAAEALKAPKTAKEFILMPRGDFHAWLNQFKEANAKRA